MDKIKLISMSVLAIFMALFLTALFSKPAFASGDVVFNITVTEKYAEASQLLELLNKSRKQNGLDAISMDNALQDAAMQRAAELALLYSHVRPDGTYITNQYKDLEGECIAHGKTTPEDILDDWLVLNDKSVAFSKTASCCGIGVVGYGGGNTSVLLVSSKKVSTDATMTGSMTRDRIVTADGENLELYILKWEQEGVEWRSWAQMCYGKTATPVFYVRDSRSSSLGYQINNNLLIYENKSPDLFTIGGSGKVTPLKTGKGSFTATLRGVCPLKTTVSFEVRSNAAYMPPVVFLPGGTKYTYTGDPIEPPVIVTDCFGVQMEEGRDYHTEYSNNVEPGTASVKVYLDGNYAGTMLQGGGCYSQSFYIEKKVEPNVSQGSRPMSPGTQAAPAVPDNDVPAAPEVPEENDNATDDESPDEEGDVATGDEDDNDTAEAAEEKTEAVISSKNTSNNTGATASKTKKKNKVSPPKKTSITKISRGKKKITVKWKKIKKVTGYQIQYARNKSFSKGKKTKTISGYKKTSITLKGLKSKKTYFVRIRTYKMIKGRKYYSSWSKTKKVTVK